MNNENRINSIIEKNNGIITTKECISNNIPSITLSRMVRNNKIERVAQGIYLDCDAFHDAYYIFSLKNKKSVFSYKSALYLLELTDRIPFNTEVTVAQGYNTRHVSEDVIVHHVLQKFYNIGIISVKTIFGNEVRCYNLERTLIDLIRSRKHIDVEIFSKAVKLYFKSLDRDTYRLREYAKIFNVEGEVNNLLDILD